MKQDQIEHLRRNLLEWYRENHRPLPWRQTNDPYRIWVSEVMLQQTKVSTVIPYYYRFLDRFTDIQSLADADMEDVLRLWEGMGYYARGRNLHRAARQVLNDYQGRIPSDLLEFKKLPGVGDYIAAAVMSIAYHQPYAVVDGNVKRILARFVCLDSAVNDPRVQKVFTTEAETFLERENPGDFNQAMMELGAIVCTPQNPNCLQCPLGSGCCAFQMQAVKRYPKRRPVRAVPEYCIATGVVYKRGKVLITRRKPEGLLGGLWEFPGGKVRVDETVAEACIREIKEEVNLNISIRGHLAQIHHAYTHFKIEMDVFQCDYVSGRIRLHGPVDYRWVPISELNRFPFPKANHKFLSMLVDRTK